MTTQSRTRPLNVEAFANLPDDGKRYELVKGVLIVVSRSKPTHGSLQVLLVADLVSHVMPRRLGKVFSDVGFVLRREPDTLRAPDIAFVAAARLVDCDLNEDFVGAPDLAIEIVSANETTDEVLCKIEEHFNAGARAVWIIYPERRKVYAYSDPNRVPIVSVEGTLTGGEVLPDFSLALADFFIRSGRTTMKHTLVALVENEPGVLNRVASLFRRRNFNIDSLTVGRTEDPNISRMTIVLDSDVTRVDQVQKNLYKLVNVIQVYEITEQPSVSRDLALIKVRASAEVAVLASQFGARIIDYSDGALVLDLSDEEDRVEQFIEALRPHGIIELVRTGVVAMGRGNHVVQAPQLA